jgi:23S rRNA (guanosine2251-2'-O)-methyltransferase
MNENKDYIFGFHSVIEAIRAGKQIDKVLFRRGEVSQLYRDTFKEVRDNHVPYQFVVPEMLDRITRKNHQGVIALLLPVELQDPMQVLPMIFESGKTPLLLALDSVTDVRNFGGIARSAECAGVQAILFPDKNSARINSDAVKTSAGAIHYLNLCRVKALPRALLDLKDSGLQIVAATEKAVDTYDSIDYTVPTVVVMGSEDEGISPEILKIADKLIRIPMRGKVASLNVSVATGIILFEAERQRRLAKI